MTTNEDVFENTYGQVGDGCRHESPVVDRESLFSAMTTMCKVLGMNQAEAEAVAVEHIGMWFNEGILLDAAAVRHEHGERIYQALGEISSLQDLPSGNVAVRPVADVLGEARQRVRDLSLAPEG